MNLKKDPKLMAFLAQSLAYGIKTGVTIENLDDYCLGLAKFISDQPIAAWAIGDRDGILVSNMHDHPTILIFPRPGITEFRMMGDMSQLDDPDFCETTTRVVLAVLGFTIDFTPDHKIVPAAGISAGEKKETTFKFKDDGFGVV